MVRPINGQKYYCCLNNNYTDLTQACSQFFNGKFTSRGDSDGHSKYLTNLYGGVWGISYHAETQGIKNGLFHCYIKGVTFTPTRTQPTITPANTTLTNQQTQKLTNDCMQLTKQDNYNKGISISTVLGCQDLKTIDNRTWTQKGNGTLVSGRKYYCCLSKKYEDIAKACKDVFNGIFTSKGKPYPDWGISYYAETQGVVYGPFHCYVKGKTK